MIVSKKEVLAAISYCAVMLCDEEHQRDIDETINLTREGIDLYWDKFYMKESEFVDKKELSDLLTFSFTDIPPKQCIDKTALIEAAVNMIMPEASDINALIVKSHINTNHVSDGYHTIGQLYDHRIANYIALCRLMAGSPAYMHIFAVWRSERHSDGSKFEGWFVLGINKEPGKQVTYHLPMDKWEDTWFAETYEKAPCFDFHTPDDVLQRIKDFI